MSNRRQQLARSLQKTITRSTHGWLLQSGLPALSGTIRPPHSDGRPYVANGIACMLSNSIFAVPR